MTMNQFAALCGKHLIAPEVALENDAVVSALKRKATLAELESILTAEF